MDSSEIQVGDVFRYPNVMADLTAQAVRDNCVKADDVWHAKEFCVLVRKADHYAGITLPEPPAGYRLAKWGEEASEAMFFRQRSGQWVVWGGPLVNDNSTYDATERHHSIYAIPLDQPSPLKSWQFRDVPWVAPEPKTLADVPDGTDCIAAPRYKTNLASVVCRRGDTVLFRNGDWSGRVSSWLPVEWMFVRYIDPPAQRPLSLDDVPDGRVILSNGCQFWRNGAAWYQLLQNGCIRLSDPEGALPWTVTNYIAEFRGPA